VGFGGAGGDDTNGFLVVCLIRSMDNQHDRTRAHGTNRYPTLLAIEGVVALRNGVRIVENKNGSFKANVMLAQVLAVLVLVPCKLHSNTRQYIILSEITGVNTIVRTGRDID
jgi:hypothetical protein